MFDFSPTGIAMAIAGSLLASLSSVAVAAVAGSLVLMLVRHRLRSVSARAALLGLAAGLGLFGLLWQGAAADGALKVLARDHALALRAERLRIDLAEGITRDLAEQATRDLAEAQATTPKLKGIDDAMAKDGRRDGVCLDRGMARRLRNL